MIRADFQPAEIAASCAGGAACLSVLKISIFRGADAYLEAPAVHAPCLYCVRTSRSTPIKFGELEPWEPMPFY